MTNPVSGHTDPVTLCWACDRLLTFAGERRPGPGDLAMCEWCGSLALVGADLSTRRPDPETYFLLASDERWRAEYVDRLRRAKWRDDIPDPGR